MNYTYRVILEPDGKYFHAFVPALSGCHSFGKTISEAKKNIQEAIQVHLEGLIKCKLPVPKDEDFKSFTTVVKVDNKIEALKKVYA